MSGEGKDRLRVAVLGFPPVVVSGLCHILSGLECDIECIDDIKGPEWDCWIVSPQGLLSSLNFFMPRRESVIVMSEMPVNGSSGFRTLGIEASCEEIADVVRGVLVQKGQEDAGSRQLSGREMDVLRCLAAGMTVKEIANRLYISANTVTTHRKNISSKLGIRSISGLSLYAVMNGIV